MKRGEWQSPVLNSDGDRVCAYCYGPMPDWKRDHAAYCTSKCRYKANWPDRRDARNLKRLTSRQNRQSR